jgi:tetratricopeptide (TPR) repeat protein
MAIFFLVIFASYTFAQSDSQPPASPWGPGIEVQPAPGWPPATTPPSQPPSTQSPPAQPAPQPEATAEQHITPAQQSENTKKANELIKKGIALLGKKKYQEALDAFKEAESLDATIPQAPFGTGMALLGLNKPAEAVEAFERARKLKPTEANIFITLACLTSKQATTQKRLNPTSKR